MGLATAVATASRWAFSSGTPSMEKMMFIKAGSWVSGCVADPMARTVGSSKRFSDMGRMAYALGLFAGFIMAGSLVLQFLSFSGAVDNLGKPEGDHMFGALMLTAFAGFLISFLSGGILWVLTDISEQLAGPKLPKGRPSIDGAFRAGSQEGN